VEKSTELTDSGDDDTDELRELGWEESEKEWSGLGWRRKEVYSKGKEMQNEMSGQWFLNNSTSKTVLDLFNWE